MKFKRILSTVLVTGMALTLLAGCGQQQGATQSGGTAQSNKTYTIGVSLDTSKDFTATVIKGVNAYAKEHPNVKVTILDANSDPATQLKHVENLISQGVDAVVMKPCDVTTTQPITQALSDAKIPLIVVNSSLPTNQTFATYVGSDNVKAGELEMQPIADKLNGKGNIAILMGEPGNQATSDRIKGNMNVIAKYPGLKVVSQQNGSWVRDKAMTIVENWLQSGMKIDAIVANNDEMAIGAALALKESNNTKILGAGIDATSDGLKMLKSGQLAVTVFQNGYQQGFEAMDATVKILQGQKLPKYEDIPFEQITPDKADQLIATLNKE
ncbi:Inositol transport system sugar-binding protein [Desulfosporosinus sp. I2]|uniref:sugar ABC transporter substrate-binding protein n=1 Tax=Desulfosporosinus sp. I2 TaxID=1617025 RepID=UPI0005F00A1E|nr:sugar ABC transporter substrate-binding protein [Desulfosporosinus sp. I2]KJR44823.1 Inositol transport system sugar-binding protein [Desulfosporosinus sp. I2]